MVYLLNWRMQIACELLQTIDQSLSAIASAVGYGSESAFSIAFYKLQSNDREPTGLRS